MLVLLVLNAPQSGEKCHAEIHSPCASHFVARAVASLQQAPESNIFNPEILNPKPLNPKPESQALEGKTAGCRDAMDLSSLDFCVEGL